MPWSVLGGMVFLLMGLGSAWVGIYVVRATRSLAHGPDADARRRWSPTETRLWLIAWMMSGLGFFSLGATALRYAKGQYMSVPASAPLIDHVIWVLIEVGVLGGFAAFCGWMVVRSAREKRERREDAGNP